MTGSPPRKVYRVSHGSGTDSQGRTDFPVAEVACWLKALDGTIQEQLGNIPAEPEAENPPVSPGSNDHINDWRRNIQVDVAASTITLRATVDRVDQAAAAFVDLLVKAEGAPVSFKEAQKQASVLEGVVITRLKKRLPEIVRQVIGSKPGSGSRLLVDLLK